MKSDPKQMDFFREAVFPTRTASEKLDIERFLSTMKREMARAIREYKGDAE